MFKSIRMLLALSAAAALAQATEIPQDSHGSQNAEDVQYLENDRQSCIKATADYVAQVEIAAPVMTLVTESRKHYPDVSELILNEVPSEMYVSELIKLGSQVDSHVDCEAIMNHIKNIPTVLACYNELALGSDEGSTMDVVEVDDRAKAVIEAYFSCVWSSRKNLD